MKTVLVQLSLFAALIIATPLPQAPAPNTAVGPAAAATPAPNGLLDPLAPPGSSTPDPFAPPAPKPQLPMKGVACPAAVNTMATGIQNNIERNDPETGIQQAMINILLQAPAPNADPARFDPEKSAMTGLLGQDIGTSAQVMSAMPDGNPAMKGLLMVIIRSPYRRCNAENKTRFRNPRSWRSIWPLL